MNEVLIGKIICNIIGKIICYIIAFLLYVSAAKLMDKWKSKQNLSGVKDLMFKIAIFILFITGFMITPPF